MKTKIPTARLLLPEGVSAGAAIGAGGCHVRTIGSRHKVRCLVNPPQREIQFLGHHSTVAHAIADFLVVFEQVLATCAEPGKFTPTNAVGDQFVHVRAVTTTSDKWTFARRDKASLSADAHTKHYEYRLVAAPTVASVGVVPVDALSEPSWLHAFTGAFRERMIKDITTLCHEKPERDVRLKAALGLTCYALRDLRLTSQTFSWCQLQALKPVDQIQPRWSSTWDTASPSVQPLLTHLLSLAADQEAETKTTLTVYVGAKHVKNCGDLVIKYRYIDSRWVPFQSHRPRRVLLAQYDVTSTESQGFRIRAYTHDVPDQVLEVVSPIVDHLDVVPPTTGSYFLTTVATRPTMPPNRFVRGVADKEKLCVDHDGLRFVVSFMNKRRSRVRIECALLATDESDKRNTEQSAVMAEATTTLMDKVLGITTANMSP